MKPKKCISTREAKELQKNWRDTRGKSIERGQGYRDTFEFSYSIEELQEYLDYVKEKSAEQGVQNPGIRIYLGAYPASGEKKSLTTIFLAPTKEIASAEEAGGDEYEDENNYDIDPLNDSQGGWPPQKY